MKKNTRSTQRLLAYCQYFAGGTSAVPDGGPSSLKVSCSVRPTRRAGSTVGRRAAAEGTGAAGGAAVALPAAGWSAGGVGLWRGSGATVLAGAAAATRGAEAATVGRGLPPAGVGVSWAQLTRPA